LPLVGRVISAANPDEVVQLIRDVADMRPIGPVAVAMSGDKIALVFDSAVGSQLTSGTNVAVTTTATPLTTTQSSGREVIVQADPTNAADILIGGSNAQEIHLVAGASLALDWTDISTIWVKSASGTLIANWLVRG
jgi:hypothetical protein